MGDSLDTSEVKNLVNQFLKAGIGWQRCPRRSSIGLHSFQGIGVLPKCLNCVTYVSGILCYLSVGSLTSTYVIFDFELGSTKRSVSAFLCYLIPESRHSNYLI
jgi:hypothetical protein